MAFFLASFSRSSGIRQKIQNAKYIFLKNKLQKKIKKNVAKNLIQDGD
jgi:hypothetical protein